MCNKPKLKKQSRMARRKKNLMRRSKKNSIRLEKRKDKYRDKDMILEDYLPPCLTYIFIEI